VAPPSDKVSTYSFCLRNQARPLHSIAHIFKITAPGCIIFGTLQFRVVLNMHVNCFT